jgi:hypothetical protein
MKQSRNVPLNEDDLPLSSHNNSKCAQDTVMPPIDSLRNAAVVVADQRSGFQSNHTEVKTSFEERSANANDQINFIGFEDIKSRIKMRMFRDGDNIKANILIQKYCQLFSLKGCTGSQLVVCFDFILFVFSVRQTFIVCLFGL